MGSDRKSKRTSPSQREEDDKRSKRHRTVEDEEKKERKREKKETREDKKSRKHSKEKSDKGKSKDKHRNKHRKGDAHTEFLQLSKDDYFAKNNEFAAWLKEEKNVFFSDLLSESARELFTDFVKAWNKGKLDSHYYEGIASGPRTSHNWKIKK
ncbi:nucleolar protein 58 [Vigna radiata var. radiata]|uniref:Nucleolar protein 58 n=1 Tax=Vigna radiata var. radiata TaxID=3916 RepID=A0A1S3TH08_VIGRR|nr:nucleolar protein 58 [Vigna radiata var. radiata]